MFKYILFTALLIYSNSNLIFAQELKSNTKGLETSSIITNNSTEETTSTDILLLKGADANVLMQVNDEGLGGSITLPSLSTIGTSTDKLYNIGSSFLLERFCSWYCRQCGRLTRLSQTTP